jgi:membrane-bound lytic murein transglycosylase D
MYRISAGDTLVGIARQFAMDVDDVSHQNRLDESDPLRVGGLLKLKVRRDLLDKVSGGAAFEGAEKTVKEKEGKEASKDANGQRPRGHADDSAAAKPHDKHVKKARRDPT